MTKQDIIYKLTSRKFWAAVAGFITSLLVIFGVDNAIVVQVAGVISATSILIAYIVGEGLTDRARLYNNCDE